MRIAVLGGTGFVGQAIATALSHDHDVVAAGLPGSRPAGLSGIRVVEADLLADGAALANVLHRADAVVYALAPRSRRGAATDRIVAAARRGSAAAAAAGVQRWVQLSNVSVYPQSDVWVDDATLAGPGFPLGRSTLSIEQAVTARLAPSGAAVAILRLGSVYAADAGLTGMWTSYLAPGTNWLSYVLREDVAAAVRLALVDRLPEICVVGDGAPVRAAQAARVAARHRGSRARALSDHAARRLGPDVHGILASSVRLRPTALLVAGWRPTVTSVRTLAAAPEGSPG